MTVEPSITKWDTGKGTEVYPLPICCTMELYGNGTLNNYWKTNYTCSIQMYITWYLVPDALISPFLIMECQFSMLEPLKEGQITDLYHSVHNNYCSAYWKANTLPCLAFACWNAASFDGGLLRSINWYFVCIDFSCWKWVKVIIGCILVCKHIHTHSAFRK